MSELKINEYLKKLEYLVNIDSVSSEPQGAGRIAAYMRELYENSGWQVKSHSFAQTTGPCLEITNHPSGQYDVLLLAHMDTVFPLGTAAQRPFQIQDGRATGPGVIDCKAGLLSGYYALQRLQREGVLSTAAVCVFLNSDHEGISSRYSQAYSAELARRSRCVLVLEAGRANGNLVHQRKGIARYKLQIKGRTAHAGVDYASGRSAIEELAYWILALQQATNLELATTVNVGKIYGGSSVSAVPGEAGAEIDVRYYQQSEVERIEQLMEEYRCHPHVAETAAAIQGGITRPPMLPTDKTRQLMAAIEAIGQEIGESFGWTASGGGSDGSFAAAAGVPTIDGLGPVGGGAHSAAEYLEISSVLPRYELLCRTIAHIIRHGACGQ